MSETPNPARRLGRSVLALTLGFVTVVVLSIGTDVLMHTLGVFPPLGQPMKSSGLLLLAFAYRSLYGVLGGYVAARLAPYSPMKHALVLGLVGLVLSTMGAISMRGMGPDWYPIALVITAVPYSWLGGLLHLKTSGRPSGNATASVVSNS